MIRITIPRHKVALKSKGFAFIEFKSESSLKHAFMLSGTLLRKRKIKVSQKRENIHGLNF